MTEREVALAQRIWDYHRIDDTLEPAELIVGLGSYDTRVAEHAASLQLQGLAPQIVLTGAEGNFTRGKWPKSEAEMFADVAIDCGVAKEAILIEPKATNTGDNVRLVRKLCDDRGIEAEKIILVAKPNMTRRGLATCQLHWPEVEVMCSSPETHFFDSPADGHTTKDVVNEIVGDLQRVIEYPKLGFQAAHEIPSDVMEAFGELVSLGFTEHLLQT
ncbi:MAG: YdcF family protein [Verrucomicrobiota bacterium]